MPKFDKRNLAELKAFLYNCYVHDAEIESVNADYGNETIAISLFNPYYDVKLNFIFHIVEIALSIKGDWYGSRKEINCIVVLDDFSYLEKYLPNNSRNNEDSIYLLFQMFSEDELHIVSKEVTVEIVK